MCKLKSATEAVGGGGCAAAALRLAARLERRAGFRSAVLWGNVASMAALHVGVGWAFCAYGLSVKWQTVVLNYVLYVMAHFGASGGVHRYWSHRSYSATRPLRVLLVACFAITGLKTIYSWVRDHRVHHKYVDTDADPQNMNRGFFFAHIGWLLMSKHPDVIRMGNKLDMSDITSDELACFYDRHWRKFVLVFSFLVPVGIGSLWGERWACSLSWRLMVYIIGLHSILSLNSFAHFVGYKPFNRLISPTDNRLLALLIADECHHNYHHTFPWDYSTSELGYMVSVTSTTQLLHAFRWLGWAYGLKHPSPQLVAAVAARCGDGSHSPAITTIRHHHQHHHEEIPDDYELKLASLDCSGSVKLE